MKRALTPAVTKRYVDGGGTACPFCDSDDIEAGLLQADGNSASGLVECHACGECWREVFTLSAVSPLDENSRETETAASEDDESTDRPAFELLFDAADAHAAAAGDPNYAVGDLQEILRAAWRIMTSWQRAALFTRPELVNLAELPEYESLINPRSRSL